MNRHHHLIVFNRARGCLMAVGEGARRMGKPASGQGAGVAMVLAAVLAVAFAGKGKAEGEDILQRNSHILAGPTAHIESGAHTTLAGAVVSGQTVHADVGGDLHIDSRQHTHRFKSDQHNAGACAGEGLCLPPLCTGRKAS